MSDITSGNGEVFTEYFLAILEASPYSTSNINLSEIIKGLKLKYDRQRAISVLSAFEWGCTGLLTSIHKGELWPHHFIGESGFIEMYKEFDRSEMPWI